MVDSGEDFPLLIPGLIHSNSDQEPPDRVVSFVNETLGELIGFIEGDLTNFTQVPIDLKGTPFQIRVWQELQKIPRGTTISYQELAKRVGNPKAARAVGQAVGANPIPIIIPCHRVIAANGSLGGYSSGLDRKRWLLEHEQTAG
ncbi:MAG: methylated-DNA--[protein]-cysteine S-methyltransferase [Deltaproteobacteria bacterium]|nr:methylated-DNA--[protein]-cysteine S-methyltransferase [Deltaproteobacteria bacterium]MBM4289637.1 methylated-DNA--[protein]-cysteine S-methyltransferase [Deltaproteobacteria bacterium]